MELAFVFALSGEGGVPAIELIRSLKDGEKVLVDMALELLERDHDVLPNFISAMNEEEATVVGKAVMNRILERPEKGGDPAIIKAIGNGTTSEEVWTKIARYYVIRGGELEGAVRIANLIRDGRLRSIIMTDVAHHLLKEGGRSRRQSMPRWRSGIRGSPPSSSRRSSLRPWGGRDFAGGLSHGTAQSADRKKRG